MGFSRRKIPRSGAYTISEKAIWFRHPDYDPDRAQKLITSSMSRHLSTRNISSKSMRTFLSNLANRLWQTDKHRQKHVPPSLSELIKWNKARWSKNHLTYTVRALRFFSKILRQSARVIILMMQIFNVHEITNMFVRTNTLIRKFSKCSAVVKTVLFKMFVWCLPVETL